MYMAGVVMSDASTTIKAVATDVNCAKPLDLIVTGIDYIQSYSSLECMGLQGRIAYKQIAIRQDSVYPVVYGLLFFFTLLCLSSYCTKAKVIITTVCSLPILIVMSDFLENHFIVNLIYEFPNLDMHTIKMLAVFNSAKWIMFFLAAVLIILFSAWALVKLLRTDRNTSQSH
jgi:hypothetical protein